MSKILNIAGIASAFTAVAIALGQLALHLYRAIA